MRTWPFSTPIIKPHTQNLVSCSVDDTISSWSPICLKILSKPIYSAAVTPLLSQNSLLIPLHKGHISLPRFQALPSRGVYLHHLSYFICHYLYIGLVHLNPLCLTSSLLLILSQDISTQFLLPEQLHSSDLPFSPIKNGCRVQQHLGKQTSSNSMA